MCCSDADDAGCLDELHDAYGEAWAEWDASGEADSWDAVVGDGI
jgi:hypothetical protein